VHESTLPSSDRPTVLVTGSAGLLGRRVCERLRDDGYYVVGFDRVGAPEPPKGPHLRDIELDITDYDNVRWAIEDVRKSRGTEIASVVHLAAFYDFSGEDSPLYREVTVHGTDRLLNHLTEFDLGQFVFSSTMLVHAPCEVGSRISEDSPLEAKWPYPESKIATEKLIVEGHPAVRSVLLRIAGVYTETGRQPTLVQQMKRIHDESFEGRVFPGNPEAGQACVHVDDAVDAIARTVAAREGIPGGTPILIGEPDPPSYQQLQVTLSELIHGTEWTTVRIPKWFAKAGAHLKQVVPGADDFVRPFMIELADDHYALDIGRAKRLLGWSPTHDLLEELPGIVARMQEDPERFFAADT